MNLNHQMGSFFTRITDEQINSFFTSLYWTLTAFVFGTIQIVIIFIWSKFDPSISYTFESTIKSGVIIFFCIAIVWSVALDFRLELNNVFTETKKDLLGSFIPSIIYLISIVLYISTFAYSQDTYNLLMTGEIILLSFTLLYAVGMKYIVILTK